SILSDKNEIVNLALDNNKISDISTITNFKKLKSLKLDKNNISSYKPLKDIYKNLVDPDFSI
ncbi:leucine-rich repeat domain-containing protein, partial [Clostridium botulinum]|nr:leucine-rich repeat domain-containing protein [Clostridium botulinum]